MIVTEKYIKIGYTTYKKVTFPDIKFILVFNELANKTVFFTLIVKPNEPVAIDANRMILQIW